MLSSSSLVKFLLVIRTSTSTVPLVSGNVQDQAMKDMGQRDISRQMGPQNLPLNPVNLGVVVKEPGETSSTHWKRPSVAPRLLRVIPVWTGPSSISRNSYLILPSRSCTCWWLGAGSFPISPNSQVGIPDGSCTCLIPEGQDLVEPSPLPKFSSPVGL